VFFWVFLWIFRNLGFHRHTKWWESRSLAFSRNSNRKKLNFINYKTPQNTFFPGLKKAVLAYFIEFPFKYCEFEWYKWIVHDVYDNITQLNPKKTNQFEPKNFTCKRKKVQWTFSPVDIRENCSLRLSSPLKSHIFEYIPYLGYLRSPEHDFRKKKVLLECRYWDNRMNIYDLFHFFECFFWVFWEFLKILGIICIRNAERVGL